MSAQPQDTTTDKQRRRRPKKAAPEPINDYDSAQTDEGTSRPKSNQNNKKKQHQESALTQELQHSGAVTPPRSQARNANRNVSDTDHVQDNAQKSIRKKRNNHQQTHDGHNANTLGPKNRNGSGNTPSKPTIAMDAYAGPTFHASPAPSSLPIPKMFSRSAPAADKDVGITARLNREESTASSGSDGSPESPSRRPNAARVVSQDVSSSGPALFDMLMNADRQEKARQLHGQSLSPPQTNTRENSVNPAHVQSLHRPSHSRTLTDSQVFPLESSNTNSQPSPSPVPSRHIPAHQLGSPFGSSGQQPTSDDNRLKRMLFSSPQGSPTPYHNNPNAQWNSSPASQATSPYASPASSNGLASTSRPAPVSPYTQASPSPSARRQGYPPHHNSNLRRELSPGGLNNTPPQLGNLPRYNTASNNGSPLTSPTQQRFGNNGSPFGGQYSEPADRFAPPVGNKRFSAQDAINSLGGNTQTSEMEDRLRQILRIDQLRPQSAQTSNRASAVPS